MLMANSRIRGSLPDRDIADELQEDRLRWYGPVLRKHHDMLQTCQTASSRKRQAI